jgi:hypothetical protein
MIEKMIGNETPEAARRDRAITSLRRKADVRRHLFIYVVVNGVSIVVWAATGGHFFWPMARRHERRSHAQVPMARPAALAGGHR